MPFAFKPLNPGNSGVLSEPDIPFSEFLGVAFEQGMHDSMYNSLMSITEQNLESSGKVISKEEANKTYAVGTLQFTEPVHESEAKLLNERKIAEMRRQYYLSQGNRSGLISGRGLAGVGAGFIGSMLNPLDLAVNFLPVVGSELAVAKVVKLGGGQMRQALARGLITSERLALKVPVAPVLTEGVIQAGTGNLIAEVPHVISAMMSKEDYTLEDSTLNVLAGTALGTALHVGVTKAARVFGIVTNHTKEVMDRKAVDDFLRGRDTKVEHFVDIDDNMIRAKVRFDEQATRQRIIESLVGEENKAKFDELTARIIAEREIGDPRTKGADENTDYVPNSLYARGKKSADAQEIIKRRDALWYYPSTQLKYIQDAIVDIVKDVNVKNLVGFAIDQQPANQTLNLYGFRRNKLGRITINKNILRRDLQLFLRNKAEGKAPQDPQTVIDVWEWILTTDTDLKDQLSLYNETTGMSGKELSKVYLANEMRARGFNEDYFDAWQISEINFENTYDPGHVLDNWPFYRRVMYEQDENLAYAIDELLEYSSPARTDNEKLWPATPEDIKTQEMISDAIAARRAEWEKISVKRFADEKQARVDELLEQERLAYDEDGHFRKEYLAELQRQIAEGKVATPEQIREYGTELVDTEKAAAKMAEDQATYKKELEDLMDDGDEFPTSLKESLDDIDNAVSSTNKGIDAAVKCLLTK